MPMIRKAGLLAAAVALGLAFAGCGGSAKPTNRGSTLTVKEVLPTVARYLEVRAGGGARRTSDGWTWFCGLRYLGHSPPQTRFDLYVWEACQEYRLHGQHLATLTGWSAPAVIAMRTLQGSYRPVAEHQPGDGDQYGLDVQRMFPLSAQKIIATINIETGPGSTMAIFAALDRRARRELTRRR